MGLKRPAALWITDEMESPALVGSIFSTIVIPGWLADDANEAKLDWALRHELMHFRLRDPWAALVRELSQMLFYFHPVAWWAGAKWKTATEKACDRAIVADEAAARDYAEQLYRILVGIHGRRQAALPHRPLRHADSNRPADRRLALRPANGPAFKRRGPCRRGARNRGHVERRRHLRRQECEAGRP